MANRDDSIYTIEAWVRRSSTSSTDNGSLESEAMDMLSSNLYFAAAQKSGRALDNGDVVRGNQVGTHSRGPVLKRLGMATDHR
jgi:hypothetical protein